MEKENDEKFISSGSYIVCQCAYSRFDCDICNNNHVDPGDCDDEGGAVECLSGPETSNSEILDIIAGVYPDLVELYKSNVGDGEEFQYADDYTTTFSQTADDPANALIIWDGPGVISCPDCFVLIKDGNQDPFWYLMELAGWDGMMDISLESFWPDQGAISHVSLFSSAVVPVPAAVWLRSVRSGWRCS